VSNGTVIEYQFNAVGACKAFFDDLPEPVDGWLTLPEEPGLGLRPNRDAVKELRQT
jgi:L-alanine-DL-glutamate epimerase-like enolase superfamily enzyme